MQEKLIEILENAKGWPLASKIAELGGWRSAANIGVTLAQMEKVGTVVRRKSPTEKMNNNMPATEWKLSTKRFAGEEAEAPVAKPKAATAIAPETTPKVSIADIANSLETMRASRDAWRDTIGAISGTDTPDNAKFYFQTLKGSLHTQSATIAEQDAKINHYVATILDLEKQVIDLRNAFGTQADKNANLVAENNSPGAYLVRTPKRTPRICKKHETAQQAALSGARTAGRSHVYALVPAGKAVRGAEWKDG